ncbi:MAG: 23S rRNA (adenine2030-N6)-methyltransferase [Celeribacter sp.]|jgi:23S rRNA (adenine2030-N6)-methyltransferase
MLSYQHGFHAGNLADVQKHALMAVMIDYLTRKDKPLSYIETHAGRGLYDLQGSQAQKTGEAAAGILKVDKWFKPDHPYARARKTVADAHGKNMYPGSPVLAQALLRDFDNMRLAELHPAEFEHLETAMRSSKSYVGLNMMQKDGFALAQSICPPTPRRGLCLIDPPYEMKSDYAMLPDYIAKLHRKWNVGIIALWYPILEGGAHKPMTNMLLDLNLPDVLHHEVRFPPAREGHGMIGSGMFIVNTPWGLSDEAARLTKLFGAL